MILIFFFPGGNGGEAYANTQHMFVLPTLITDTGAGPNDDDLLEAEAREKFSELDDDGNGYLEGVEIEQMAMWARSSLYPGQTPAASVLRKLSRVLAKTIDSDRDGKVDFDEFLTWFHDCKRNMKEMQKHRSDGRPTAFLDAAEYSALCSKRKASSKRGVSKRGVSKCTVLGSSEHKTRQSGGSKQSSNSSSTQTTEES